MFDFLSKKFSSIFSRLKGSTTITQDLLDESLGKVKDALLEADVPYRVVEDFAAAVAQELTGQKLQGSLKADELLAKTVHDKVVEFLGGKAGTPFGFQLPSVVMVMGLQGSGKTTSVGKMANFVAQEAAKRGKTRRILVGSVDFYRPAAVDQLEVLAGQANVTFYRATSTNPVAAAQEIFDTYKKGGYELLFLDTAGRMHIDNTMLQELRDIDARLNPRYKLLVLDAMTGQESLTVAQAFDQGVGFHSSILSKMDSDTRGGAAFAFRYTLKKPIAFVGVGEKLDDMQQFHPERAAGRMLDMGDLQTLAERANAKIKESDQEQMYRSFKRGSITLEDFAKQMDMVNKLGSLSSLVKYMPGMGGQNLSQDTIDKGEHEMKRFRAIVSSMTLKERLEPRILNGSRKNRIASGAGVAPSDIQVLLQRFEQVQQYAKLFKRSPLFKQLFK